jgi:hypothetical protein
METLENRRLQNSGCPLQGVVLTVGRGRPAVVDVTLLDALGAGVPVMPMTSGVVDEDSDEEVNVAFRAAERVDVKDAVEVSTAGVICVTRLLGTGGIDRIEDVCAEAQRAYRVQRSRGTVGETMIYR